MAPGEKVIIVGAGLGGLALAARLATHGFSVDVYEKNPLPGGRVAQKKVKGYTIDLGPTFLLMPGEFEELFSYCGKNIRDYVQWEKISPLYRLHYWNSTHLDVHADLPAMKNEFERFDPARASIHFQGFLDFLTHEQEKHAIVYECFITRPAHSLRQLLFSRDFPKLFSVDAFISMWENAHAFFEDDKLALAFSFQSMYVGESPLVAPGTYSIIPFVELTQGVWYPHGGMQFLVNAVEKLAKQMGVSIHYNRRVEEIIVENGIATGVRVQNNEMKYADIVVCNLDLPAAYSKLLPARVKKKYSDKALSKLKYGCSAFMLYLGIKGDFPQLTHHNVFFDENYLENFTQIFDTREVSARPSVYVNVPTKTNPKLAPKGKHLLYVLVPVPYAAKKDGKEVDWNAFKKEFAERVIQSLEARDLSGLKKRIEMMEIFTPSDWEALAGMHLGSTFGLSPTFFQSSVFRPRQRSEEAKNLYFVGASTHPGSGMPLVLIGARTAEMLIQNDRARK